MNPEERTDALMEDMTDFIMWNHPTLGSSHMRMHQDTFVNQLADYVAQIRESHETEASWRADEIQRYRMEAAHD